MTSPARDTEPFSLDQARADRKAGELMLMAGNRVREARKAMGLSRRELSERSGVSPRTLAQLESGDGNISIGLLNRVALALDEPVDGLLRERTDGPDDLAELMRLLKKADPAMRMRIWQMLDPARKASDKAERICLIGLRGAGKSTLGARLGAALGMRFVELNREIEDRAGIPLAEIIALYGEEGYRQLEADTLTDIISGHQRIVLAVAGGIVSQSGAFLAVLTRFHTIWVKASPEEHMERVRAQGDLRPMAGNPQAMAQLRQILKNREEEYRKADFRIDTTGKTVDASLSELKNLIIEKQIVEAPAGE